MKSKNNERGNPVLWRLYWGFMLTDIAHQNDMDATSYVKSKLHEIHKKYLKYPTTAGVSHEIMSQFLFEVCALWACFGVFVRTKDEQPRDILNRSLHDMWKYL